QVPLHVRQAPAVRIGLGTPRTASLSQHPAPALQRNRLRFHRPPGPLTANTRALASVSAIPPVLPPSAAPQAEAPHATSGRSLPCRTHNWRSPGSNRLRTPDTPVLPASQTAARVAAGKQSVRASIHTLRPAHARPPTPHLHLHPGDNSSPTTTERSAA